MLIRRLYDLKDNEHRLKEKILGFQIKTAEENKKKKRIVTSGERQKKKAWEDGEIKGTAACLGFGDLFPISDSKDEKSK